MNLTQIVYLGARSLVLGGIFLGMATRPSRAQPLQDLNFLHFNPLDRFEQLRIEPVVPIARTLEECLANPTFTFAISQRGGLADDPLQTLRDRTLWSDVRPLEETQMGILEPPVDDESASVETELSQLEDPDLSDVHICQVLFDN